MITINTSDTANQGLPYLVNENTVVYQGSDVYQGPNEIYIYDIITHTEHKITSDSSLTTEQIFSTFYGNKIVYYGLDKNYMEWGVYVYDLTTNTEINVPISLPPYGITTTDMYSLDIYENKIAISLSDWNGHLAIGIYDLTTNTQKLIKTLNMDF